MKLVALTTRRDPVPGRDETRDSLETAWWNLLDRVGVVPLVIPNHTEQARALLETLHPTAVILTGGGAPATTSSQRSTRDEIETLLISHATTSALPLLGVCRGMQAIGIHFGGQLHDVAGHVARTTNITTRFGTHDARCFHERALATVPDGFSALANAPDGLVEAIEHRIYPIRGVMWHPERSPEPGAADVALLSDLLR